MAHSLDIRRVRETNNTVIISRRFHIDEIILKGTDTNRSTGIKDDWSLVLSKVSRRNLRVERIQTSQIKRETSSVFILGEEISLMRWRHQTKGEVEQIGVTIHQIIKFLCIMTEVGWFRRFRVSRAKSKVVFIPRRRNRAFPGLLPSLFVLCVLDGALSFIFAFLVAKLGP